MKMFIVPCLLAWGLTAAAAAETEVPGTADWTVDTPARAGDVKTAPFAGRPDALWLRANTHALRKGVAFVDGVIEFDLAPMERGDFAGLTFRRDSSTDYENIYFRLSRSGEFMAVQYSPRVNGSSTWQLYPEFTAKADWPRNAWTHVRVEVRGSQLVVFVGNGTTPVLTVPRLRQDKAGREVTFWARVNNKPAEWAAAVANVAIRLDPRPTAPLRPGSSPAGYISSWQVAGTEDFTGREISPAPAGAEAWTAVTAEENGLVNLNRLFKAQPGRKLTAYARTVLTSDTARRLQAGIGYSDDVVVFLNGERLYAGRNGWESRTPQFASFVDSRFETVWLPLRPGENELVLAVTDDQFFGWGFAVTTNVDKP